MSENTKPGQNWRKLEAYHAAAKAVGLTSDPVFCHTLEDFEEISRNNGDIESKPYDLRESMSHEDCGQYMQGLQAKRVAHRAAGFPEKTLGEIINEIQQKLDNFKKDLVELGRNMESIKGNLEYPGEGNDSNVADNAYKSDEDSIADTEDLEYDLSESDELCDFGAPANETQPSLRALSSPTTVHSISLEALNHQIYLLKQELTQRTDNIPTIYDLISTTLCMIEACNDLKSLRSDDELRIVSNISANIKESQAAFEKLRLQEDCISSTFTRQLSVAFSAFLDSLLERTRQYGSSGSVSEHNQTAGATKYRTRQQNLSVTKAQVMTSDEDYPPPLPQSPTSIPNSSNYHGGEVKANHRAPISLRFETHEPQKILLPRGFTIRSLDPQHPNLSFPDPSMVIHFEDDATREHIQDFLRLECEAYERSGISRYKARCWVFEREQRVWLIEAIEPWLIHCERIANLGESWNHFKYGKGQTVLMSGNNVVETPHGKEIKVRGWESRLQEGHCLVGTCCGGNYADDSTEACKASDVLSLVQSSLKKEEGIEENDESQYQNSWSEKKPGSILTRNMEGRTIYWSVKLPRRFTIPSRNPYQAGLTFLDESVCLGIPYDTDENTRKLIFNRERRWNQECIKIFEGDQRVWLTDAISVWWKGIEHSTRSLKEWEDFRKRGGCLVVLSNTNFTLRPCGNVREDRSSLRDYGPREFYELAKAPPIPIRHPEFYYTQGVLRQFSPSTTLANSGTEKSIMYISCTVTFLPAGFTLPSYVSHKGNLVFRNAAYAYNFPLGGTPSNDIYKVLQKEINPAKHTILTVRSAQQKQQLKDSILAWWATMPLDFKGIEYWPGFENGDTYIITDQYSIDGQINESADRSHLRGGDTDPKIHVPAKDETFEYRNSENGFEHPHGELMGQNTGVRNGPSPSPCGEAWVKPADLLQMQNICVQHEVKKLHATNSSLYKDAQWHVDVLENLGKGLKKARLDRTATLARAKDLKVQVGLSKNDQMFSTTLSNDRGSTYAGLAGSASDTSSISCRTDITTKCTYGSQQHDCRQPRPETAKDHLPNSSLGRKQTPSNHAATCFYFFPRTSLILLMRSPPLLFQWPSNTTLPQIYRDLIHRHNNGVKDDPILDIMDILDIREILDIHPPDPMRDEVIKVSIPDLGDMHSLEENIPIAAWGAFDLAIDNNSRDWKDWWGDVVEPESQCLQSPTYSDRSSYADANEFFGDWPWDTDATGGFQYEDEQSSFAETRSHHLCCNDAYPSSRGDRDDDFDKTHPTEPDNNASLYDSGFSCRR